MLIDILLNFRSIYSIVIEPSVFNFTMFDNFPNLCLDIAIGEILLVKEKFWVFSSERRVIDSCLGGVSPVGSLRINALMEGCASASLRLLLLAR